MPRIKNHKPIIIFLVVFLIILSAIVLFAPDMKSIHCVRVHNQSIKITQGDAELIHTDVDLNNSGKVNNKNIDSVNKNLSLNNRDLSVNNKSGFKNNGNIYNQNINYNNSGINTPSGKFKFQNSSKYRREMERYKYEDINWGKWKSRFVNRILDDSLYIKCLDTYGLGTWFYYSFVVTNDGKIHDVTVMSFYLSEKDKSEIRTLIRSYEGTPITLFPEKSKRKKAKIKAIMLLGDTEQKAKSSSFGDTERVKIKY